jgi:protein-L-isoaspartate(D-aspartate) O-methyltransferase
LCAFGKLRNLSRNLTGNRHIQRETMNLEEARTQMLGQQIRAWEVLDDRVLDVLREIPREAFVPESQPELAFADLEIPLAHDQYMMTPKMEGRLMQALAIEPTDSVLEIGTGSGFLTACLARLAKTVVSVDIYEDFSQDAKGKVGNLDISNVEFRTEDALQMGHQEKFDAIAVTGSVPEPDEHFVRMLRPGGRLFIIVGREPAMEAQVVTMHPGGEIERESLFESVVAPLVNAERPEPFVL